MEIKKFDYRYTKDILPLLSANTPYVFPHHPYIYWIMREYFPSLSFVAQEDGVIEGFVCALHSAEKNCVFIWQLVVSDTHRRTGTAKLLCEKILEYANENRVGSIQITVSDKNIASIAFFTSLAEQVGSVLNKISLAGLDCFEDESAYEILGHVW